MQIKKNTYLMTIDNNDTDGIDIYKIECTPSKMKEIMKKEIIGYARTFSTKSVEISVSDDDRMTGYIQCPNHHIEFQAVIIDEVQDYKDDESVSNKEIQNIADEAEIDLFHGSGTGGLTKEIICGKEN